MDPVTTSLEMPTLMQSLLGIFSSKAFLLIFALSFSGCFILKIASKWCILEKAGERGWAALVPFYGNYCFHDITWDNGWVFLASYIPGVNYALNVITMVKLSCRFDKNSVFTLGLVAFEPVFLAILGFDDSEFFA